MLISSYCDDQYCHKMIISTQQGPYWRLHRKAICSNNAVVLEVLEVRMRINLSLVACPPLVTWWTYQTFPDIPDLPDLLKKWNISIRKLARLILHTVCWSLDSILLSCVFFLFFVLVLVLVLVLFSVMVLVLPRGLHCTRPAHSEAGLGAFCSLGEEDRLHCNHEYSNTPHWGKLALYNTTDGIKDKKFNQWYETCEYLPT